MEKIIIKIGIPKKFVINLKKDGNLFDLTGLTYIRLSIQNDSGHKKVYYPLTAGKNEVQSLTFSATCVTVNSAGSPKMCGGKVFAVQK